MEHVLGKYENPAAVHPNARQYYAEGTGMCPVDGTIFFSAEKNVKCSACGNWITNGRPKPYIGE